MSSTINQLSTDNNPSLSDQIIIWSTVNGDSRKTSLTTLQALLVPSITSSEKITQYASPVVSGFSVQITDSNRSIWLILSPISAFAAGTLTLPALANLVDKQEITVFTTNAITTLTTNTNGATSLGIPVTLAQNGYFTIKFDAVMSTWYRIS